MLCHFTSGLTTTPLVRRRGDEKITLCRIMSPSEGKCMSSAAKFPESPLIILNSQKNCSALPELHTLDSVHGKKELNIVFESGCIFV